MTVYFAHRDGRIKIGYSANVSTRMRNLGAELLAVAPGAGKAERGYHRWFASERIEGEWFRPSPELMAFIETMPPPAASKPAEPVKPVVLSVEDVAHHLSISAWSVRAAIRRGELPHFRIGRRVLIPIAALNRMMACALSTPTCEAAPPAVGVFNGLAVHRDVHGEVTSGRAAARPSPAQPTHSK